MTTDRWPVDVVVPAWGRYLQTLPEAIASAVGAHVIAVVDDDGVPAARAYGCQVVARPPGGVGPARDAGLAAGSAPYVLFLDADDCLLPGALEELVSRMSRAPRRVIAVTGALRRRSDGSSWPPARAAQIACLPGMGPLLLVRNVLPSVGACLVRRSAVPPGSPLFPALEDEDWHAAVTLRAAGAVRPSRRQLVDYADSPGSVSRRARDPLALARSHDRLVRAAEVSPCHLWWRLADRMARGIRGRSAAALLDRWGRARPSSARSDVGDSRPR